MSSTDQMYSSSKLVTLSHPQRETQDLCAGCQVLPVKSAIGLGSRQLKICDYNLGGRSCNIHGDYFVGFDVMDVVYVCHFFMV